MQKAEIECKKLKLKIIDRQVEKFYHNKMAERFGESNDILIESLKDNSKNKNTQQSSNNWIKVWKTWAAENGHDDSTESYEPEVLNKILEDLYTTVRKKD